MTSLNIVSVKEILSSKSIMNMSISEVYKNFKNFKLVGNQDYDLYFEYDCDGKIAANSIKNNINRLRSDIKSFTLKLSDCIEIYKVTIDSPGYIENVGGSYGPCDLLEAIDKYSSEQSETYDVVPTDFKGILDDCENFTYTLLNGKTFLRIIIITMINDDRFKTTVVDVLNK